MRRCQHPDAPEKYKDQPFVGGVGCIHCWKYHNPGRDWRTVPTPDLAPPNVRASRACRHRGSEMAETVCPTCPGSKQAQVGKGAGTRIKTFGCARHGQCQALPTLPGVKDCGNCNEYALPEIRTRSLLYHLYPVWGNSSWRRRVERLLPRLPLFNGKKLIAVMTGPTCEAPEEVFKAFGSAPVQFHVLPNNPGLREVASFETLFAAVETREPHHATLYAHGKGVRTTLADPVQRWIEAMEEIHLDYWPAVERSLNQFPITGAFRCDISGFKESSSSWHYSGSWHWFRNREVFVKPNWKEVEQFWSGIETYPSLLFKREEAGCLFYNFAHGGALYDAAYWDANVAQTWERWKAEHSADRREGPA